MRAALLLYITGFIALTCVIMIQPLQFRTYLPRLWTLRRELDWIQFLGGLFGAIYTASAVYLSSVSSFGAAFVSIVCGQAFMSLLIDHLGWQGAKRRPITGLKLIGLFLIAGGLVMFQNFNQHLTAGVAAGYVLGTLLLASFPSSAVSGSL
jgi:uncharacterized membrane protein YdcZ (DUF606 family)